MKKPLPILYTILLFLMMFGFRPLTGQQKEADSLIVLLNKYTESDTLRANLLISIANSLYLTDPEKSITYANELEELAFSDASGKQNISWDKYHSEALMLKGKSYLSQGQNDKADSVFMAGVKLWQKKGDKNKEAKAHFKIGWIWQSFSGYPDALEHYNLSLALENELGNRTDAGVILYQIGSVYDDLGEFLPADENTRKAYDIFKELGDEKRMAICLNNLGNFQNSLGDNTKALDFFLQALKINEALNNTDEISKNLNNIGVVYLGMEKYSKAREYFLQSFVIISKSGKKESILRGLGNIGITYSAEDNFKKALEYFQQVLQLSREIGNKPAISTTYNNIARIYEDMNESEKALEYYSMAFAINDSIGDKKSMIYNLVGLGDVSGDLGNYEQAAIYLKQARSLAMQIGARYSEKDALQGLTEMYAVQKQYDSAFKYFQIYSNLKDTLLNQENIEEVTRKEMQYGFDKKMLEEHLRSELEINKQKNRKNIFLVAGLGIFAMLIGLWSRLNYIRKSRAIIKKEKDRSEELLLNILPAEVAEELKEKGFAEAKHFDEVTVLFSDFKGFTLMAEKLSPAELVHEIDFCFKKFDEITTKFGIEKIKTIGDAYMCAGGLPVSNKTNPTDIVKAALEIQSFMEILKTGRIKEDKPYFELRIGIHTGPVVAGIVGIKKFQYDIWGDTVNIASRMESSGAVGKVNISQMTYEKIRDQFECEYRGKIEAKNKGTVDMYFVNGAI
jgi:class 3 adenylate cyclase/Tfp pilus assembly protein PilF